MYQILQNRLRVSPIVAIAFSLFVLSGDASATEESVTTGFEENPTDVVSSDNSVEQTLTQSQAVEESTDSTSSVLEQINQYNNEEAGNLGQVNNVSQLADVQPGDWAYEALRSLVERYGAMVAERTAFGIACRISFESLD